MKIISGNLWGGKMFDRFSSFFKNHCEVDVFCFQEVFNYYENRVGTSGEQYSLRQIIRSQFPHFNEFYRESLYDTSMSGEKINYLSYGLQSLIHKDVEIVSEGDFMVFGSKTNLLDKSAPTNRNIQYITLKINDLNVTILNFHGIWIPDYGKGDCKERLEQSENIIRFLHSINGEIILLGDFNLDPDTRSLKMLEECNLRNLIIENKIDTTRSSFYSKSGKFADYMLVSSRVRVNKFEVLDVEISDHLPMFLDFDIV